MHERDKWAHFLTRLGSDQKHGIEEYQKLFAKVELLFRARGFPDPHHLAGVTMDRVVSHVDRIEPGKEAAYARGVAKYVQKEEWVKTPPLPLPRLPANTRDTRLDCLRKCARECGIDLNEMIDYDEGTIMKRREMAERLGMSWGNLRVRMCRRRKELANCIAGCLDFKSETRKQRKIE